MIAKLDGRKVWKSHGLCFSPVRLDRHQSKVYDRTRDISSGQFCHRWSELQNRSTIDASATVKFSIVLATISSKILLRYAAFHSIQSSYVARKLCDVTQGQIQDLVNWGGPKSFGRLCLRQALEALGFFITKYAFSPFWGTFWYYFWNDKILIFFDKLSWKLFCT